jgi:hypothetical protein
MKSISQKIERKVERIAKVNNNNSPIFCYITYYDHYKNNRPLSNDEIIENLKNPVVLECFGTFQHENDDYIVIKSLNSEERYFIFKSCIKEKIIYCPKREGE